MRNPLKNLFDPAKPSRKLLNAFTDAAAKGDTATVAAFLKEYSAYVDKKDKSGHTALMRAAMEGCTNTALLLLKAGADPHKKTSHYDQSTALLEADRRNYRELGAILRAWPDAPKLPVVVKEKTPAKPASKH